MGYNYRDKMVEDIMNVLGDYKSRENFETREDYVSWLEEQLFINDAVTGNGSGSYTFNTERAKEYVIDNLDLAKEAYNEYGQLEELGMDIVDGNWENIDVTIRCYLLPQVLYDIEL